MSFWRYSSFSVFFFVFGPTFLTLGPFLGATPLCVKKTNYIFWKFILSWTFPKKNFQKISKNKKARQILKIFDRAISSHLISFRFLPFSGHFRTVPEHENRSTRSRKIWWSRRKKNQDDISWGTGFIGDQKKSLFR